MDNFTNETNTTNTTFLNNTWSSLYNSQECLNGLNLLLNLLLNNGFLFLMLILHFINLFNSKFSVKWLKNKLITKLDIYDKIFNQYITTDKIQEKKNTIIKKRRDWLKENSQIFKEVDLSDVKINN